MVPGRNFNSNVALSFKSMIEKTKGKYEEHIFYLKPISVRRGMENRFKYCDMPIGDLKRHFNDMLFIANNGCQKNN